MAPLFAGLLLLASVLAPASGQDRDSAAPTPAAPPPAASTRTNPAASTALFAPDADLARRLALLASHAEGMDVPPAESVTVGDRRIEAGERVAGSVAVASGDLHVFGEITGDALALDGDVVVHPGGVLRGDAMTVSGRVRLEGGTIEGEMRSLSELPTSPAAAAAVSPVEQTRRAVGIAVGWLVMLTVLGVGVLIFAGTYLEGVTETMTERFARSFWVGVLGQVALIPALLVLIVGLALTILGILLIPFAIVAYVLGIAGLLAIGFLAVARVTGAAVVRSRRSDVRHERAASLRALILGLGLYLGLWVLAAAFTWAPVAGLVLRSIAVVVTWVAVTVGFGATILSRAGTRRPVAPPEPARFADEISWQTPTPVAGVVAARRPTPPPRRTEPA